MAKLIENESERNSYRIVRNGQEIGLCYRQDINPGLRNARSHWLVIYDADCLDAAEQQDGTSHHEKFSTFKEAHSFVKTL